MIKAENMMTGIINREKWFLNKMFDCSLTLK
jgi:hypothetical protein